MIKFITLEERNRIADELRRNQGPLLPASIDEAVDGKISYADLKKGLTIRFPFVEGMREGGRYHVSLDAEVASFGIGGVIQEENQDTVVAVPADTALAFQGQEALLRYYYFEFDEPSSPHTQYSIEGWIFKPQVDEAVDGVIPLAVLSQGVNLRIRPGSSLTPGALVTIYWWGTNTDSCFVRDLKIGSDQVEDLVVRVEPAYLTSNKYGDVRVIYTVQSMAGTAISRVLELRIAGEVAMPEPRYVRSEGGRVPARLEAIEDDGGIPMRIKTQGMVVGDVAILFFVASVYRNSEFVLRHTVSDSDIAAGEIKFAVPAPFFSMGFEGKAWSIVQRQSGKAVGSPDGLLSLPEDWDRNDSSVRRAGPASRLLG